MRLGQTPNLGLDRTTESVATARTRRRGLFSPFAISAFVFPSPNPESLFSSPGLIRAGSNQGPTAYGAWRGYTLVAPAMFFQEWLERVFDCAP